MQLSSCFCKINYICSGCRCVCREVKGRDMTGLITSFKTYDIIYTSSMCKFYRHNIMYHSLFMCNYFFSSNTI